MDDFVLNNNIYLNNNKNIIINYNTQTIIYNNGGRYEGDYKNDKKEGKRNRLF